MENTAKFWPFSEQLQEVVFDTILVFTFEIVRYEILLDTKPKAKKDPCLTIELELQLTET